MGDTDIRVLLQQGIAAAKEGNRTAARELFERVVDLDEQNEKGWFWLASVVDNDEERRICLNNVLTINPDNERAKEAMAKLDSRQKKAMQEEEVAPGITRKEVMIAVGGGVGVIILVLVVLVGISSGNAAREAEITQAAAAFAATGTQQYLNLFVYPSETAVAGTSTAIALTPQPTNTSSVPTLPPEFTPTPSATPLVTATPLPPPVGLRGLLTSWRGNDIFDNGYMDVGYYNLEQTINFTQVTTDLGAHVSFFPSGQRIIYTRYDDLSFTSVIDAANLNGSQLETISNRWAGTGVGILRPQMPDVSADGRAVVFVGEPQEQVNTLQVFVLTLADVAAGTSPVRQLTRDDARYYNPQVSPDGTRVVAVRDVRNQQPSGVDIVVIDIQSGGIIPVTIDYDTFAEAYPRWSPDGRQIVYAAAPSTDPENYDIVVRNADGSGSPTLLVRDPANDNNPVISPDGRSLAFASTRSGAWDIYVLDITTGQVTQLTASEEQDYPGDWFALPG